MTPSITLSPPRTAAVVLKPVSCDRVRELVAEGMTAREVAAAVGSSRKTIIRLVLEHNLGPWIGKPGMKPGDTSHIPADFAKAFETSTYRQLAERFQISLSTVHQYARKLGLSKPGVAKAEPAPKTAPRARPRPWGFKAAPRAILRNDTDAGKAADFLRRYGPVIRCDADGRYAEKGDFYRIGSSVLGHSEIIERAARKGWDADAWKRVAA